MKRIFAALLAVVAAICVTLAVSAGEAEQLEISVPSGQQLLTDGARQSKLAFSAQSTISLSSPDEISSLYLVFDAPAPASVTVSANGGSYIFDEGFIHHFIELPEPASELTLTLSDDSVLCDVYAFSEGEPPGWVQRWQKNDAPCDVLFLPTHIDDDMLYFGAALAMASDREGAEVQLAYMVNHNGEYYRPHELLNGLWELNITRYPIISPFPDMYSSSLEHAKTIYDEEALLEYKTGLIKKLRPQIVFAHDLNGEYGHGAQVLNAVTSVAAVERAAEAPDGHDVKKLYVHLYGQSPILLDCDAPLESFGGASAYEMAVRGFSHNSSQNSFFSVDREGPYNIREFGLYRTTVGADTGNDFFENITLYRDMSPEPPAEAPSAQQLEQGVPGAESVSEPQGGAADVHPHADKKELFLPEAKNDRIFAFLGSKPVLITLLCLPPVLFFLGLIKVTDEDNFPA